MKKNILLVLLGMIIMLGIGVIADNLNANEVDYRDTKVDQALDTLYEKSTYTEYDGSTEVTPTATQQTLSTNNKLLKSNITINPIPSGYKDITGTTITSSIDVINGKVAFDANGNMITGTNNSGCTNGSITCTSCTTANGQALGINFNPSMFYVYGNNGISATVWYYNTAISTTQFTSFNNSGTSQSTLTNRFRLNNDLIIHDFPSGSWENKTLYYVACK